MFGIDDPFIILPYLLSVVCVIFAAWFGLKYWNKDDEKTKPDEYIYSWTNCGSLSAVTGTTSAFWDIRKQRIPVTIW